MVVLMHVRSKRMLHWREGHGIQTSFTSAMMLKQQTQQRLVLMVAIYKMVIAKADLAANIIPKIPNLIPNFIYQLS